MILEQKRAEPPARRAISGKDDSGFLYVVAHH
jgi:hypothetical protein